MLTPDYLLRVAEGAEEIASELHSEIVNRIIKRIAIRLGRGDDYILTALDKWQLETLQDAGYLLNDLQEVIAQKSKLQKQEIKSAFEEAGVENINYDNKVYEAAGLSPAPLLASPYLIRLLQRGYEATQGEWSNYTRTTANAAQRLFIRECDKAYNLVASGAMSYTQAVKEAVETIANEGVTVTYPSGHTDTIETATLRAVRTGISQSCANITDARMDEMGWDIILVSSHPGARVTDAEDFTNHSWWQGKFYSKSGESEIYPPFEVCGMGHVQGIHGANCRHFHGPGDGIHNPFEQYDSEENKKAYELQQRQRLLERRIRNTKRAVMAEKTFVDAVTNPETKAVMEAEYQKKAALLQKQNAEYNAFCEANGLKPLQDRLKIAKWDRKQAAAARGTVKHAKTVANRAIVRGTPEEKLNLYFKEKAVIDSLDSHGVKYIQRINAEEVAVDAGTPTITGETKHFIENRENKADRAGMDLESTRQLIQSAKLALYQQKRLTIKFIAEDGYAVLSLNGKLVTAVPQRWRKKYDKILEDIQNGATGQ